MTPINQQQIKVTKRVIRSRRAVRAAKRTLRGVRSHSRFSRRRFLRRTAAAGLLMGLSPELTKPQAQNNSSRTLFFNLAHEDSLYSSNSNQQKQYFFTIAGSTYQLKRLGPHSDVLARARASNAFLSAVPVSQITHYLDDLVLPTEITPLGYLYSVIDQEAGTWSMSGIVQELLPDSIGPAYQHAREITPDGPLPLSVKRQFYGIDAAVTVQDLADEFVLIDYTDMARTLIGVQPDLLCANPPAAEDIAVNYININAGTLFLAHLIEDLGPAMPQDTPSQRNTNGWATLIPLKQDDGTPFKMLDGLNQYFPDWSPAIDAQMAGSVSILVPQVKNDTSLGANITGLSPDSNASSNSSIQQELTGKIWYRHDGTTAVDHGAVPYINSAAPKWDFHQKNGETGLQVRQPTVNVLPDDKVQITFDNVANWFFRYLGIYVQFVDQYGNVIPAANLPPDTLPDHPGGSPGLDRGNALFAGIVPPVFSVAGIPVYPPGEFSFVVNRPPQASTINLFYGGLGFSGSAIGPERLTDVGLGFTTSVNFGVVALFMAAGVSTFADTFPLFTAFAELLAVQIVVLLEPLLSTGEAPSIVDIGIVILEGILNGLAAKGLEKLTQIILTKMLAAQLIGSIPVAGVIARAAAAVIGAIYLAATLIEVGISPPVYHFDLSFTHDLSFTIRPDERAGVFPDVPAGYTMYYKVDYLFDNGSPHFLDNRDVTDQRTPIPVTLTGIPWGGQVNISVGFYVRKTSAPPSENDWCAAKGTTGLVSNTVDTAPDIIVENILVPIQQSTVYIHTSKITLDAQGHHRWTNTATPPPYVPPSGGQQPGNMAALRAITVRQATAYNAGYVGYSWQSYSSGVLGCSTGGRAQLDQAANLNTSRGNNGQDAQSGYATTPCGLSGGGLTGLTLSYSPLIDNSANFYLDSSSLLLREVQLAPVPEFTDPLSGKSFGKLNLDSTKLLLHPAGHIVSINNTHSKIEALQLPPEALDDSAAAKHFLARTYSGEGTRPGLIKSPVSACISAEGAILVLEDSLGNNRIQAFDLGGNPVPYFTNQPSPYFLQLPVTEGATYLDVAVEFTGYIYVLSRSSNPPVFRLDIYHYAQSGTQPICRTQGINAARLTVDFWRNVYTLNYEVLRLPSGQVPPRTEPSVSFWVPPPPTV